MNLISTDIVTGRRYIRRYRSWNIYFGLVELAFDKKSLLMLATKTWLPLNLKFIPGFRAEMDCRWRWKLCGNGYVRLGSGEELPRISVQQNSLLLAYWSAGSETGLRDKAGEWRCPGHLQKSSAVEWPGQSGTGAFGQHHLHPVPRGETHQASWERLHQQTTSPG